MDADDALALPPPTSGLFLEVSFRRLLASCEEIAAGNDKGRENLRHWQTSPVFHHYVETLQEQLADLEGSSRIHPDLVDEYKKRTKALSNALQRAEVPDLCRLLSPMQTASTFATNTATPSGLRNGVKAPPRPGGRVLPPAAPAVTVLKAVALANTASSSAPPMKPISLSATAQARLDAQNRAQESLTDELVGLAAAMKTNTLAMEAKVKERGTLLDGTEAALDKSVADTKAAAAQATAAHRRGRVNFCFTCLVMFIIGIGFAGMYIFIRITSLTGYKAAKAVPKAAPLPPPPAVVVDNQVPYDGDGILPHEEL